MLRDEQPLHYVHCLGQNTGFPFSELLRFLLKVQQTVLCSRVPLFTYKISYWLDSIYEGEYAVFFPRLCDLTKYTQTHKCTDIHRFTNQHTQTQIYTVIQRGRHRYASRQTYTHISTGIHRHRYTHRHTERQAQIHTHRSTHPHTHTQMPTHK